MYEIINVHGDKETISEEDFAILFGDTELLPCGDGAFIKYEISLN